MTYDEKVPDPRKKYKKLSIVRGHLFLNDDHITTSRRICQDQITWSLELPDEVLEFGALCFYPDRLSGYGKIGYKYKYLSSDEVPPKEITIEDASICFSFTSDQIEFNCQKTTITIKELHTDDTIKQIGQSIQNFGTISFRKNISDNNSKIILKLQTPTVDLSSEDLNDSIVLMIDDKNQLNFYVYIPAEYQPVVGYTRLSGILIWNYQSFEGEVVPFDDTKPGNESDPFLLLGMTNRSSDYDRKLNIVREYALANISSHPLLSRSALAINKKAVCPELIEFANSLSLDHTCLQDLSVIVAHTPEIVHTHSFNLLKEATVESTSVEWIQKIFGTLKMKADSSEIESKSQDFLENVFAKAYTGLIVAWSKNVGDKLLNDKSRNKLLYFWNGNENESLCNIKEFSFLTYACSLKAFTSLSPQLQKYTKQLNSKYLAKSLFDNIMTLQNVHPLTLSISSPLSMTLLQKYSMLCEILNPGSTYTVDLHRNVLARQIYLMSDFYKGSEEDRKTMYSFVIILLPN